MFTSSTGMFLQPKTGMFVDSIGMLMAMFYQSSRWLNLGPNGQVMDRNTTPVKLVGVNTAGLEFGDALGGDISQARITAVTNLLYCNVWRVSINTSWWLNNVLLTDGVTHYQTWIKQVIGWIQSAGCYVEIDLTTAFCTVPGSPGPAQNTVDSCNNTEALIVASNIAFFQSFLPTYNQPSFIYNIWNEPVQADTITQNNTIISALRTIHASSLVVAFAHDDTDLVNGTYTYPQNVILDYHLYDNAGNTWQTVLAGLQATFIFEQAHNYAIMFGEWSEAQATTNSNNPNGMAQTMADYVWSLKFGMCFYNEQNLLNGDNVTLSADGLNAVQANHTALLGNMNYYTQIIANAPLGYYRLDETAGTIAYDQTNHANNGTLGGTRTASQTSALLGDYDGAMLFDGTSGLVTLPVLLGGLTTNMTLEFWVKLPSSSVHGAAIHIGTATDFTGWGVGFGNGNQDTPGTQLIGAIDGIAWVLPGGSALSINVWHYVAVVIDSSSKFHFYVDGAVYGIVTSDQISHVSHANSYIASQGDGTRFLNATIDEVAVYNVALSAAQILADYNLGHLG